MKESNKVLVLECDGCGRLLYLSENSSLNGCILKCTCERYYEIKGIKDVKSIEDKETRK